MCFALSGQRKQQKMFVGMTALNAKGRVSVRDVTAEDGAAVRALVTGVLDIKRDSNDSHSASMHDHAHSQRTPSHVLNWSKYSASAVVHNASVADGTSALDANNTPTPTTVKELSNLGLVDLLAAVLDVKPVLRNKPAAQLLAETAAASATTTTAVPAATDRRRAFAFVASTSGTLRLSVGATALPGAATTDCMRYGHTYLMSAQAYETYSFPFDAAFSKYTTQESTLPHTYLGANPRANLNSDVYEIGDDVADWEVDDVGAGMLTAFAASATSGVTVRRSMTPSAVLQVSKADVINNVSSSPTTWFLLDKTAYEVRFVQVTTPCVLRCLGHSDLVFDVRADEHVRISIARKRDLTFEYKITPPGNKTPAVFALSSDTYTQLLANVGGADVVYELKYAKSSTGCLRAAPVGASTSTWNQVQARGIRASERQHLRTAAARTSNVAALLQAERDFDEVSHVLEHIEWPDGGNAFFGFQAAPRLSGGSVRLASTTNVQLSTLQGGVQLDETTLKDGDRILLKDQAAAAENGIYTVNTLNIERAADFRGAAAIAGSLAVVTQGAANSGRSYICTNKASQAVQFGVTPITFVEYVRWPKVQEVIGGTDLPVDRSVELHKMRIDGYNRYTFAAHRALQSDSATNGFRSVTAAGGQLYLGTQSFKLLPTPAFTSAWVAQPYFTDVGSANTWEYTD